MFFCIQGFRKYAKLSYFNLPKKKKSWNKVYTSRQSRHHLQLERLLPRQSQHDSRAKNNCTCHIGPKVCHHFLYMDNRRASDESWCLACNPIPNQRIPSAFFFWLWAAWAGFVLLRTGFDLGPGFGLGAGFGLSGSVLV